MKAQKLNRRQAYQALFLSIFNFTLKHILGTKIGKADKLSRRLDQKIDVEKDNENQVFIKDHWLHSLSEIVIKGPKIDILVKILREEEWKIERDLVLKKGKVYVPKNKDIEGGNNPVAL